MKKIIILVAVLLLPACNVFAEHHEGHMHDTKTVGEKVGDAVDAVKEGVENAAEGKNPLQEKGSVEKAGEYIDEKAEQFGDAARDLKDKALDKGPAEKAGEAVDEAIANTGK